MPIFVSPQWLHSELQNKAIKVIDASWYLPTSGRDAYKEFQTLHIPGAQYLDLDVISDTASPLPHMLPNSEYFAQIIGALGIHNDDHVVIYDSMGLFSAPRMRWVFKCFGHKKISLLRGGFPAWLTFGLPTETKIQISLPYQYEILTPLAYAIDKADVEIAIQNHITIIDARAIDRFNGDVDEPRPGLRRGHIPTSKNLPFGQLIQKNQLKPRAELIKIFESIGVDTTKPIITTCGSGVTAAIIDIALEVLDCPDRKLYDGSWAEWGLIED